MSDPIEFRKRVHMVLNELQGREKPENPHEKFLRALLHVIAGIIAALTIIIAAAIQSLGTSTATMGKVSILYTIIFSELVMYLAHMVFLATVIAIVVQILRFFNKWWNKIYVSDTGQHCGARTRRFFNRVCPPKWLYSIIALVVVVFMLIPLIAATKIAVCGASALFKTSRNTDTNNVKGAINNLLPALIPIDCSGSVNRWFPEQVQPSSSPL